MNKVSVPNTRLLYRLPGTEFWVGGSDLEAAATFRWFYSGEQLGGDLWEAGQPGRGSCVALQPR